MGNSQCRTFHIVCALLVCASLHGQTVIADSTYNTEDWSVEVVTTFGASESHEQRLTGGNPDAYRYMEHILPAPPGPEDLTRVEVTHIFNGEAFISFLDSIYTIDYSENIRLLNLQWDQAFIVSYPAIRQSNKYFRATQFLSVIGDTMWTSGMITGLTADDFIALDGSDDKPDFSDSGSFLFFGFWRISTRGVTLPPIPAIEDLIYQHGSDNFTVTIHHGPTKNQRPVARSDEYLYLDYFFNSQKTLHVLRNDSDPEGDTIRIVSVDEPAFGGTIQSFNDSTIVYTIDSPLFEGLESDFFLYAITDGELSSFEAFVTMYFCLCPLECIQLFLADPPDRIANILAGNSKDALRSVGDSLDLELFRRFRDEVLLPTEAGTDFVDLYYHFAPEVMPLFLIHRRDLGRQAFNALGLMQGPLRNLLEGDSSEMITQQLIDSVNIFIDSLLAASSDSLRNALESELMRLCPLIELAGLTVGQAALSAICDTMNTMVEDHGSSDSHNVILQQNFPNPFSRGATSQSSMGHATQISYTLPKSAHVLLIIYDIHGRKIKTLIDTFEPAGEKSISWDGTDNQGRIMQPGIYFYQLNTVGFSETKEMVLIE